MPNPASPPPAANKASHVQQTDCCLAEIARPLRPSYPAASREMQASAATSTFPKKSPRARKYDWPTKPIASARTVSNVPLRLRPNQSAGNSKAAPAEFHKFAREIKCDATSPTLPSAPETALQKVR